MNLSKACYESIESLVYRFHHSLDLDYLNEHWYQYMHAIQLLAEVAFQQDAFVELGECGDISDLDQEEYLRQARLKAKNFVMEQLMQGDPELSSTAQLLAGVAMVSPRFSKLIADVKEWRRSPDGIAEILKQKKSVDFEAWCRAIDEEIQMWREREDGEDC